MKINTIFLAAGALFLAIGCAREMDVAIQEVSGEIQTLTVIGPAPIQFEAITGSSDTKGTSVQDGSALLFNWAVGDTLGIFPNKGNQVEFPISAAQGSTSASFDGGGWALRNNASYAGYYPFSVWNYHRDNETILLDYSGQVQDGNGSFAHLSKYDFLASNKTTPQGSAVTFQMERQGSILYIDIVVPEPETITSLTISCDEAIFVEKASLNISGETPVVTPIKTTESLTLSFKNTVTTSNNETVRAYMAVQPVDFTQKTVTATLTTESGSYTAPVTSRVVNKGRAAFLRFSDDFTPVNIEFADAEVKRICVENWDTNGDGELSYKEAAAVTDLGTVFRGTDSEPSPITSFNELKYFINLTNIEACAFMWCKSLVSITIPEGVTRIGSFAFYRCTSLTSFRIPDSVTTIISDAFIYCTGLTSIFIPDSVISIGDTQFIGCHSLKEFQGRYASSDGRCLINNGVVIAFAPHGLDSYVIPSGVTSIGEGAFSDCSQLLSIEIPEGVKTIESGAFSGCTNLTSINIPESVTRIGDEVFSHCSTLTSVFIPWNVESLGKGAFYNCPKMTSFQGKYASVDGRCLIDNEEIVAFAPYGITTYAIPETVTAIGNNVFGVCTNLESIVIPNGVVSIGGLAFYICSNLSSVTIPHSVINIGRGAFHACRNLAKIECLAEEPPSMDSWSAFEKNSSCPIYVPNESVEAYKAAPGWSDYADRIVGMDVEGTVVGPEPQNPD